MECAGKGSRTACCGPPVRRCERCRAVAYCSLSHQLSHRSVHKRECARLEQQMKRADILNEFPFSFTKEATQIEETSCSFLTRHGIHLLGMWMSECSCGVLAHSLDNSRLINCWNLLSELCPCKAPSSPIPGRLTTWKDYYKWRCIPLNSPAALLLHWNLFDEILSVKPLRPRLILEIVVQEGPVLALSTYLVGTFPMLKKQTRKRTSSAGSLRRTASTFPRSKGAHRLCRTFNFTSQALETAKKKSFIKDGAYNHIFLQLHKSLARDGEKIELYTYAQCNETDCGCKYPVEDLRDTTMTCQLCPITLRLHAGYYHDCFRESLKGSSPHIIIAPNAGVAAYTSWLPTLELVKELKVAAVFSDYCEEASHLAAGCISSVTGASPKIQIQINPFRHPRLIEGSVLCLPCHSNCFLFGM